MKIFSTITILVGILYALMSFTSGIIYSVKYEVFDAVTLMYYLAHIFVGVAIFSIGVVLKDYFTNHITD